MDFLLFTLTIANIISKKNLENIGVLTYTDDMVLAFVNLTEIEKSLDSLIKWVTLKKKGQINEEKQHHNPEGR